MAKAYKHQMAAGALCRGGHIKSVGAKPLGVLAVLAHCHREATRAPLTRGTADVLRASECCLSGRRPPTGLPSSGQLGRGPRLLQE